MEKEPTLDATDTAGPGASGPHPFVTVTGFMGTGKTETGRALAGLLGLDFADMDDLIERQEGAAVSAIFADKGEAYFRDLERAVCADLVKRSGLVVATGGGTLLDEKNRNTFSGKGPVVLLEASWKTILERVKGDTARPLLAPPKQGEGKAGLEDRIHELLEARRPAYHRIGLRFDTSDLRPREAACRIAAALDLPFQSIPLRVPAGVLKSLPGRKAEDQGVAKEPGATRIEISRGILSRLGDRIRTLGRPSKVFLLLPAVIREHYLDQMAASLDRAELAFEPMVIRDGDKEKNLDQVNEIIETMASAGAGRDALVVCAGGGVTGDLGGFAASIYMRGVPLVQVPTTLLAQVDAGIGGKTGVNHPKAKNMIGAFHPPLLVLCDPCALRTLPEKEIACGMAAVVQTALLGSPGLFEFMERELAKDPAKKLRHLDFLERCVKECAALKAGIVERDPFERDERRVLNLGHTLGHALEAIGDYTGLTHGQAVSIGTVAAFRIATARGLIEETLLHRVLDLLVRCGLPITPPPFDQGDFLDSLALDKKKKAGRLCFVLPVRLGKTVIKDDVSLEEMLAALGQ